jgi:hypothetical protein
MSVGTMMINAISVTAGTLAGCVAVGAGLAIRVRGARGLIRGVDWTRVRDAEGLAHYVSLLLIGIGALVMLRGPLDLALRAEPALRHATDAFLSTLVVVLVACMWLVKRRFQRTDPRNEQR